MLFTTPFFIGKNTTTAHFKNLFGKEKHKAKLAVIKIFEHGQSNMVKKVFSNHMQHLTDR